MRRALEIGLIVLLSAIGLYWLWGTPLMWCAELPVFVLLVVLNVIFPDWWKGPVGWILAIVDYRRPDPAIERRKKGQCSKCGYDLLGNLSGTCPEFDAEIDYLPPMVRPHRRRDQAAGEE